MNFNQTLTLFVILSVVVVGVSYFGVRMSKYSTLNQLHNTVEALQDKQASFFDSHWKTLKQLAQVDTAFVAQEQKYFDTWKEAISKTGNFEQSTNTIIPMMFQQAGLDGPNTVFKEKLSQVIKDGNKDFEIVRNEVIASINQYNNFVGDPWTPFFGINEQKLDAKDFLILSSKTNNALITGEDNEVDIY